MFNYITTFNGIEGQLRASSYRHAKSGGRQKLNVFDSLQDAIGQHRAAVNDHYNNII